MSQLSKFRYEFPPMEAHFLEAPNVDAAVRFLKRTYPHNFDQVIPTLVKIPRWPAFWKQLDQDGRELPWNAREQTASTPAASASSPSLTPEQQAERDRARNCETRAKKNQTP